MRKILLLSISMLLLFSCKKEHTESTNSSIETQDFVNNHGRLQFKSTEALNTVLSQLQNKDDDYLNRWEKSLSFKSLRNSDDAEGRMDSFGFPDFYASIINNNGEYMVGDTIVWFNKGFKYIFPKKDEALLDKTKLNPESYSLKYKAGLVPFNKTNQPNLQNNGQVVQNVQLGSGQIDARYQYYFNNDTGSKRKLIFEIQNYVEQNPFAYVCYVHTRIKQEYLAKEPYTWKPAGETTEKRITNLSYDIAFSNTGNGALTHVTGSNINTGTQTNGSNLDYVMCTFQASNPSINATVSGEYYAKVVVPNNSQGLYNIFATW